MFCDLPRYEDQRRTMMPWCPSVPAHWRMSRNKIVMATKKEMVGAQSSEYDLLSLTKAGVISRDISTGKGKIPASFDTYQLIESGDLIMCLFDVDETPRTVGRARKRGMITGAYDRFVVPDDVLAEYVKWFYLSVDDVKGLRPLYRGLRKTVPLDRFMASHFPLPSPEEQAAIVKYLAHANARIDKAIAAKRRLISLLEEQKASVAYDRLTRGYEPNDLRVVGLPWADSIPQHWALAPVKRLFSSMVYGTSESSTGEGPVTAVGMGEIKNGNVAVVRRGGLANIPEGLELRQNDLLFNRTNSPDLVGKVGRMTGDCEDLTFASYLVRCRVAEEIDPEWAAYLLNDRAFLGFARSQAFVSLHQANLSPTRYGALPAVIPPYDEQCRIADGLRKELAEFNGTVDRVTREIQLLQEFRTRLVADVVTGQVDVRAIAAPLLDAPLELFDDAIVELDDDLEEALVGSED